MYTPPRRASVAAGNLTRGETAILAFMNGDLLLDQLKQQAARFLVNGELLHEIKGLTSEEQTKFVDKVDQVSRHGPFSLQPLELSPSRSLERYIRPSVHKTRDS